MPENTFIRGARGLISTFLAATAISVLTLGVASPASAETEPAPENNLTITADRPKVSVGETITVTVAAESLVDAYAYELTIGFDPALLALVDGSEVFPVGGFSSATLADGVLSAVATRLGTSPGLSGAQSLVTLTFTALAPGDAAVTLLSGTLVDSAGASADVEPGADTSTVISGADDGGGTDPGSGGGTGGSGSNGSTPPPAETDPLASTGAEAAPWIVAAALALAAAAGGIVLILRRRSVKS
ncbi:cohesin domain-containing protein [Microbacterium sp. LTA6]|uniref:cohesin domain-containing protein n=1 Tax=Microbacterium sp. LTA6 TaxID=3129771 RepID=UPI00324C1561